MDLIQDIFQTDWVLETRQVEWILKHTLGLVPHPFNTLGKMEDATTIHSLHQGSPRVPGGRGHMLKGKLWMKGRRSWMSCLAVLQESWTTVLQSQA